MGGKIWRKSKKIMVISMSIILTIGTIINSQPLSVKAFQELKVEEVGSPSPKKAPKSKMKDSQGLLYAPIENEEGYVITNQELWVSLGDCTKKNIVIPDTFQGKKVTMIAPFGFWKDNALRRITLGKNINRINEFAFKGCKNLSRVNFKGNSLKEIWPDAFAECTSLKKINLPKGLELISYRAFRKSGLKEIVVPDTVTSFGDGAFKNCKGLKKVVLGEENLSIPKNCFEGCKNLNKMVIPKKVEEIEKNAFQNCTKLKKLIFEGDVYNIHADAFAGTPYEKRNRNKGDYFIVNGSILETYVEAKGDIIIDGSEKFNGQTIRGIASTAYQNNKQLGNVVLKNLKGIGGEAFEYCKADSMEIQNVEIIEGEAIDYCEIETISLKNIKKIHTYLFRDGKIKELSMEAIGECWERHIPQSVEKFILNGIEEEISLPDFGPNLKEAEVRGNISFVFYGYGEKSSSMEKLTIETPNELYWVKLGIADSDVYFKGCEKLKDIYLKVGGVSPTIEGVIPENVTLHVPAEQVEEYQKYVTCKVVAW